MIICNLKRILNDKGITQNEAQELTGYSRQTISNLEHNKALPKYKTINKLCNRLNVAPNELLTFISDNFSFKIIKHYSKTVADDNNGTYWVHLVVKAINPHYYKNADKSFTPKSIGYFNFDTKITAESNLLTVGYQISKSIPLYDLRKLGLSPLDRNYLLSVVSNKHNLVDCVLNAVSLHYIGIIKGVSGINPRNINRGTDSYEINLGKIRIAPVNVANGFPSRDPYEYIIDFDKLPYLTGTIAINRANKWFINGTASFNKTQLNVDPNNKRDMRIFSYYSPHSNYGGNGINDITDNYYHPNHEMFINAEFHKTSVEYNKIANKVSKLNRLRNKIKAHNDKLRKSEHDKLDKAVKDFNKESSERAKRIIAKNHLNHNK